MDEIRIYDRALSLVEIQALAQEAPPPSPSSGVYFPPPGELIGVQDQRIPQEVGLDQNIVTTLQGTIRQGRWALWRDGYLVHVEGSFDAEREIASARKTIHAATVGALIQRGTIPSVDQPISVWNFELTGCDANATWRHVMTQTTAFDEGTLCPGDLWAYSDANPPQLNRALARAWRNTTSTDYTVNYDEVIGGALLDPIGAQGWSTTAQADGVRLTMDLEDLGRVGLLLVTGGVWNGQRLIPESFVNDLATKQTSGIEPNFDNANDGLTGICHINDCPTDGFAESPYGFFSWVNTDLDLWPNASSTWATALGNGGHYLAWDRSSGIVIAILASLDDFDPVLGDTRPGWPIPIRSVIETIQANITGSNPLLN